MLHKNTESRPSLVTATAAAALSAVALAGCSVGGSSGGEHHNKLMSLQTAQLNKSAKLGGFGLAGYKQVLEIAANSQDDYEGPRLGQSADAPLKLGETIKSFSGITQGFIFTPSTSPNGTVVSYQYNDAKLYTTSHETVTFTNSNRNFFQDGYASPKEVTNFFNAPDTELTTYTMRDDDDLVCNFDMSFTGKSVNFKPLHDTLGACDMYTEETSQALVNDLVNGRLGS